MNADAIIASKSQPRFFWLWYWVTVAVLGFLCLYTLTDTLTGGPRLYANATGKVTIASKFERDFLDRLPLLIDRHLAHKDRAKAEIEKEIDRTIDALFATLDPLVSTFVSNHYTVRGQYFELITLFAYKLGLAAQDKLFDQVKFKKELEHTLHEINRLSSQSIQKMLLLSRAETKSSLGLRESEMGSLQRIVTLTENEFGGRYRPSLVALGGSVFAIAALSKLRGALNSTFAKLGTRIVTGMASKGLVKVATAGKAAAEAAALCAPGGPFAVGGCVLLGGVIVWVLADSAIISVDEYMNRSELENEIRSTIESAKLAIKKELKDNYAQLVDQLVGRNIDALKGLSPADALSSQRKLY